MSIKKTNQSDVSNPVVEIAYGKVGGIVTTNGTINFKGVPYGAATSSKNRFMPPVKPTPWTGVSTGTEARIISPQLNPDAPPIPEDSIDNGKRPVMVWLHGGGYSMGSGSNINYDGANLSRRGDVVAVNVTHRLNVLGFTYLGELAGDEFAMSGNAGVLDILAALEWVRDNIACFGGDPGNVTIYGESGGGGKVGTMISMPAAKGLFHRAIIQSGAIKQFQTPYESTLIAEKLLAELGLKNSEARKLQDIDLSLLMKAHFAVAPGMAEGPMAGFAPMVDGVSILKHPFSPVANPLAADVPLMIGSNETEPTLFMLEVDAVFNLDESQLAERITFTVGAQNAKAALDLYREKYPGTTPSDRFFLLLSDRSA